MQHLRRPEQPAVSCAGGFDELRFTNPRRVPHPAVPAVEARVLHSVHARSEIERGSGFGTGVGVPVSLRPAVRVPRWRSLAARLELACELHPERNPMVDDLSAIAAKSSRRLWWRCQRCGHEWQATVGSRAAGSGCPGCDRQRKRGPRTVGRERSLQASHPELAAEWHPTRNRELNPADVSPGSKHRAWWCCAACGHRWQAAVHNRARGSGCPVWAKAPCEDSERGRARALARGQASGDRRRAAPAAQPRDRSAWARRAFGPEAVVAVRQLRA